MNWSWPSFATAVTLGAVLFIPRGGHLRLKAFCSVAFIGAGEAILIGGADGDILANALVFLSAGLLFLAEIATVRANPLVPLMWIVCGTVGFAVLMWRRDELTEWLDARRLTVAVGCAAVSLLFGALAVRGQRLRNTVRYDPHDLSGF